MSQPSVDPAAAGVSEQSPVADRASALCGFLGELQQLRTRREHSLDAYRSVLWYDEFPRDPRLVWPAGEDPDPSLPWLSIDRVEHTQPPVPPPAVAPWLPEAQLRNFRQAEPSLRETAQLPTELVDPDGGRSTEYVERRLEDHPEVERAYEEWLPGWREWAQQELACADIVHAYQRLYTIYQDLTENPHLYEFVLAFGLLTCGSGGRDVKRHLVTVRAGVGFDPETGRLTVEPRQAGERPELEEDMLDERDRLGEPARGEVSDLLRADEGSLWGSDAIIEPALRRWVNGVSSDGRYLEHLGPHRAEAARMVVSYAPALILRERNRRSYVSAYEQIRRTIEEMGEVPDGFRRLVEITDAPVGADSGETQQAGDGEGEIYFPGPANREQLDVVRRLRRQPMVLTQGPPGTGKTHTIANLLSHLLAEGQRVLVTSHTTRALRVLREKLPPEIQDLCVRLTDDRPSARGDLEQSVQTIQDRLAEWTSGNLGRQLDRQRERHEDRLGDARLRRAEAAAALREIKDAECSDYAPGIADYQGTPQQIAERLRQESSRLGWLGPVEDPQPAIDSADAAEFLRLLRAATPEVRGRAGSVVAEELEPAAFAGLVVRIREAAERVEVTREVQDSEAFRALGGVPPDERRGLDAAIREALRLYDELRARREEWLAGALDDVCQKRERVWRARRDVLASALDAVEAPSEITREQLVTGLDQLELGQALEQATVVHERLAAGKGLRGPLGWKSRALKSAQPLVEAVRVDGQRCETLSVAEVVRAQLDIEKALQPVEREWGVEAAAGAPAGRRVARLKDATAGLDRLLDLGANLRTVQEQVAQVAGMPGLDWSAPETWRYVARCLDAVRDHELKRDVESQLDPLTTALRRTAASTIAVPAVQAMLHAVEGLDTDAYGAAYARMQEAREANAVLDDLTRARGRIAAGHARLAQWMEAEPHDPVWDERVAVLRQAWAWSATDARLGQLTDPSEERRLREVLAAADDEIMDSKRKLAETYGWAHCLGRLTQRHSYHLNSYARTMRKIGKGTGKHAPRYREEAQKHLVQCQGAVPAWIMPLHRLVESLSFETPHVFDVVIIDEASESGLESLLLHWLAPRVLVVGDDRQISPADIGVDHETVFGMQRRHLSGLPDPQLYSPATSLFDVTDRLTSGGRLMLKEHFRCMPEIIEFSNQLCYRGQLQPLRQFAAERLDPVRTTYVPEGAVRGQGQSQTNGAEAEELVGRIEKCCADPAYDGTTMGVITLLGSRQPRVIQQLLVERLGVREMEARGLRVGNPEDFQGDERDVIFLSMVSALEGEDGEPRRIGPLSTEMHERRINVAASRARDQMWLFHSVRPRDLSSKDLRRELLEYCLNPERHHDESGMGPVSPDTLQPPFESVFEQRVYLALRERGYRVRPQYEVAGRRIDLVVEGSAKRLAVECDGDAFHGADEEEDDALRQRELERMGWTFWRIRGSTFFRDPRAALESLWTTLQEQGIEPLDLRDASEDVTAEAGMQGTGRRAWQEEPVTEPGSAIDPAPRPSTDPPDDSTVDPVPEAAALSRGEAVSRRNRGAAASSRDEVDAAERPGSTRARQERRRAEPQDKRDARPMLPRQRDSLRLSLRAEERLRSEVQAIRRWLNEPAEVSGAVDRAAAQAHHHERRVKQATLTGRLEELESVLRDAYPDPQHSGGYRVTPGCLVGIRYEGESGTEYYEMTMMESADAEPLRPDSPLGMSLRNKEIGEVVSYLRPDGRRLTVIIESIED